MKKKIVFLTGAGISAESGIPTFRGAIDGLWENHNVEEAATALAIKKNPELVYKFMNELRNKYKDCRPPTIRIDIEVLKFKNDWINKPNHICM